MKLFEDRIVELRKDKVQYEKLADKNDKYIRLVRDAIENMRYASLSLDDILKEISPDIKKAGFEIK